jgi:hypothetical protein
LPLYVGVVGFSVTVALTLVRNARRGTASVALWTALGGARPIVATDARPDPRRRPESDPLD